MVAAAATTAAAAAALEAAEADVEATAPDIVRGDFPVPPPPVTPTAFNTPPIYGANVTAFDESADRFQAGPLRLRRPTTYRVRDPRVLSNTTPWSETRCRRPRAISELEQPMDPTRTCVNSAV